MVAYTISGGATVATARGTAVSVATFCGGDATESGMQALEEVLEGRDCCRYEGIGQVGLRPCNELGFKQEWVGRIAGFVECM